MRCIKFGVIFNWCECYFDKSCFFIGMISLSCTKHAVPLVLGAYWIWPSNKSPDEPWWSIWTVGSLQLRDSNMKFHPRRLMWRDAVQQLLLSSCIRAAPTCTGFRLLAPAAFGVCDRRKKTRRFGRLGKHWKRPWLAELSCPQKCTQPSGWRWPF
jgi:hypothetical protein